MIEKKELLSENLKDYLDYSMEVMNALDGAPHHNQEETKNVNDKIATLKEYLKNLELSYNETSPFGNSLSNEGLSDVIL
ncbi:hypothetical protein [Pedobacter sp. Leaf176]|uniref:hypothetical protein n=1 Tax=Pedobacter sp. Leaf176 TaxID=1736286 RepID=UPI0006FDFB8D|nr:hypothetical protein [Pedobacter sp. Leaf176]KQR72169.1 hypothetical protein ASF92_02385 [Pedobacter sp. Leaf176]